jgi:MFS family permease
MWLLALTYLPASFVLGFLPARLGRLSDNLGRVPLVAIGLSVSGIASLLVPELPDLVWLTVCFTCNAIGIVTAAPAQKALVGDLTARQGWGTAYGLYAFAGSLGTAIGPLLGGWLYESLGRPVPFYANGIVLLASAGSMLFLGRRRLLRASTPTVRRTATRRPGFSSK